MRERDRKEIGLPVKPFLYTLDQISVLIEVPVDNLKTHYLHYDGRSIGPRPKDRMLARNIAPAGVTPEWRVAQNEFVRWLRHKGFRYYDRGWINS